MLLHKLNCLVMKPKVCRFNIAVQFKEVLFNNTIKFNAFIAKIGDLDGFFGHFEFDALGATYSDNDDSIPKIDKKADFYLNNDIKISNGMIK